jgi:hypothetical protein
LSTQNPLPARSKEWVCSRPLPEIAGSNPAGAWICVSCECCVLSGSGLCDGAIPRPEESYRLCVRVCVCVCVCLYACVIGCNTKAGDTPSSRHVSSRDVTSAVGLFNIEFWRRLSLLSTLLTSNDLTWCFGRLTCQHASQISVVAHIS